MAALQPVQSPSMPRSIDRLPSEMLGEIFLRIHEDEIGFERGDANDADDDEDDLPDLLEDSDADSDAPPAPRDPDPAEFAAAAAVATVSRVCRAWRAAAVGHPALWSHIEFDFYKIGRGLRHRQRFLHAWMRYLRIHLTRSGAHPISLYICSLNIGSSDWDSGSHSQRALRELVDALPRCRVFRLDVTCFDLGTTDYYLPWQFQVATPFLEEFTLVCLSRDRQPFKYVHNDSATFLPHAPRLRKLRVDCGIPGCAMLSSFPALDELEFASANFSSPRPIDIVHTLRASRHISKFYIPGYCDDVRRVRAPLSAAQANPALALPRLRVISSLVSIGALEPVVPILVCPNLRTVASGSYTGIDSEFRVLSLLGGTITMLSFGHFGEHFTAGTLPQVLRAVPLLEEISFGSTTFHANDFRVLCAPDEATGRWIAPRLQRVTCENASLTGPVSDVQTGILRFVRSRTSRIPEGTLVQPLRHFAIGRAGSSRHITQLVPEIERLLRMARGDVSKI